MYKGIITKPLIAILPIIVIIPILCQIISGFHTGGLNIFCRFLFALITPSFEKSVITSGIKGLEITLAIAILSWVLSLSFGLLLGAFSSYKIAYILKVPKFIPIIIRRFLAIPRATHELIWGLLLLQVFGLNIWIAIISITIPYSSLMARVFSEQIDEIGLSKIEALQSTGAGGLQILLTGLFPQTISIIQTYGFYRLECALRGATLLGIFGLGGIGTELQLSIMSLKFNEIWTYLWILFIAIFLIEKILGWVQNPIHYINNLASYTITILILIFTFLLISIWWLDTLGLSIITSVNFKMISTPNIHTISMTFIELPWTKLLLDTLLLTISAASIAIAIPPVLLMIFPDKLSENIFTTLWIMCRIIPPPLTALILLLFTDPSIAVGGLALGIQNMGVMGKLLKENINKQSKNKYYAISSVGSSKQQAWLYGKFSPQSTGYLRYALYRTDIILRETIVVGVVGGIGLGWQLKESLSSFAWEEVLLIAGVFILMSLIGETFIEKLQSIIHENNFQST